jgi:hypothetical protein
MSLTDAGAGANPFIGGVYDFGQIIVGDYFDRNAHSPPGNGSVDCHNDAF